MRILRRKSATVLSLQILRIYFKHHDHGDTSVIMTHCTVTFPSWYRSLPQLVDCARTTVRMDIGCALHDAEIVQ